MVKKILARLNRGRKITVKTPEPRKTTSILRPTTKHVKFQPEQPSKKRSVAKQEYSSEDETPSKNVSRKRQRHAPVEQEEDEEGTESSASDSRSLGDDTEEEEEDPRELEYQTRLNNIRSQIFNGRFY